MKPSTIFTVMDLAFRARENGHVFNPLFVGPPGVGKSQIVQAYCEAKGIPFIDIRLAYYEAPDLIGFPTIVMKGDRQVTRHCTPDFWPTGGTGVILLEEPNRGTTSVMNTCMQLLTDRKINDYVLPDGWVIAACINPESEHYDVNTMDPALKDRFEIFSVDYNREDFISYMKAKQWDQSIINFVETNTFVWTAPENISKNEGAKYISPRTLSKLNAALKAGIPASDDDSLERIIYDSILGRITGTAFYVFKNNAQPVLYRDLVDPKTYHHAIDKLKAFSDPNNYKAGTVAVTIRDIIEDGTIADGLLANVLVALPADQGPELMRKLAFKRGDKTNELVKRICRDYPVVKEYLQNVLNQA